MVTAAHFPIPLTGFFEDHGRRLVITVPFIYIDLEEDHNITVPAGFVTDFNSTPRGLWNVLPPWEYPEAGVVHDWLYKHPSGLYGYSNDMVELSRRNVDDIHRRILDLSGAGWFKRQSMWLGIRSGGWVPWNKYRHDDLSSESVQTPIGDKPIDEKVPDSPS